MKDDEVLELLASVEGDLENYIELKKMMTRYFELKDEFLESVLDKFDKKGEKLHPIMDELEVLKKKIKEALKK